MARRKQTSSRKARDTQSSQNPRKAQTLPGGATRRFRSRGIEVEIAELPVGARESAAVEVKLDGKPITVSIVDGKFHSQLANQFEAFESIDELVDALLSTEGRTWTLDGRFRDEHGEKSGAAPVPRGGHPHGGHGGSPGGGQGGGHGHDPDQGHGHGGAQ